MERSWYAVTETCLAFTVFRDDFSPKFVSLFTLLLFLKGFHWLAEDRIDYVSQNIFSKYFFNDFILFRHLSIYLKKLITDEFVLPLLISKFINYC